MAESLVKATVVITEAQWLGTIFCSPLKIWDQPSLPGHGPRKLTHMNGPQALLHSGFQSGSVGQRCTALQGQGGLPVVFDPRSQLLLEGPLHKVFSLS